MNEGDSPTRRRTYGSTLGIVVFLLPGVGLYTLFMLYPTIQSFIYSLVEWEVLKPTTRFAGFGNYARLLNDEVVRIALANNARAWLLYAAVALPLAIMLAFALSRKARGASMFRFLYYIPNVCAASVLALIWRFLLTQEFGLNALLRRLGLGSLILPWLSADGIVQWTTNLPQTWSRVGFWTVIFLAAISGISEELYEAAQLDGANAWHELWYITLPGIRGVYVSANVLAMTWALSTYIYQYILTQGGPLYLSETLMTHTLNTLFENQNWGYGSTLAVFQFVLSAVVSLSVWRFLRRGDQTIGGMA